MKKKTRRDGLSTGQRFQRWLRRHHTPERIDEAEAVPMRRDLVTLLEYVRDNKVVGTQSTGNMQLKTIREVTARFVVPPVLDTTIGNHTYKLRTEYEVWPLHFMHILAEVGGLLWIVPGRRWRLTPDALRFLDMDPLFQLSFLLFVWWFQINWLVAYPVGGLGEDLPDSLEQVTLARLRAIRPGTKVSIEDFADGLIAAAGLTWTAQDMSAAPMLLRGAVRRMVIHVLEDFGAVRCTYRPHRLISDLKDLVSFEVTPLGVALLDSLVIQEG
jgi:hypothetical protein